MEERLVRFRARTILSILGIVIATAAVLEVLLLARGVIIWVLIAAFLALALNPAVDAVQRRGIERRGAAVAITFVAALLVIVVVAALFVPTLIREVNDFADAVPTYVQDLTEGRGRLGFLERDYQIVEKVPRRARAAGRGRGPRPLEHRALGDEEHRHGRGRAPDDHVPHPLHAARGAAVDRALLRTPRRGAAAALARCRAGDLPRRRRLRGREPAHKFDRWCSLRRRFADCRNPLCRRARSARGLARSCPARGSHDCGGDRLDGRVPQRELGARPDRRRVLPALPAIREPRTPAHGVRADGAALTARRAHRRAGRGRARRSHRRAGAIPIAGTIQVVLRDWLDHRRHQLVARPPGVLET